MVVSDDLPIEFLAVKMAGYRGALPVIYKGGIDIADDGVDAQRSLNCSIYGDGPFSIASKGRPLIFKRAIQLGKYIT